MEPCSSIQGSQPLSRYGDRRLDDLTLGITRSIPGRCCVGSTDLSRLLGRDCSRHGQCYLPDKEFRYLRTVQCCCSYRFASVGAWSFLPSSVGCPTVRTISSRCASAGPAYSL